MTAVVVAARGFAKGGASPSWGGFERAPDPLSAAARSFLGARNARLPRLDRSTLAALVAAHLEIEGAPRPRVLVLAVDDGCACADRAYWTTACGRGGLDASPSLFAATLPSAAAGELAMTFGLCGPCVVLAGSGAAESCGDTAARLAAGAAGGPCLTVRLKGWGGDGDGEASATMEPPGKFVT